MFIFLSFIFLFSLESSSRRPQSTVDADENDEWYDTIIINHFLIYMTHIHF